MPEKITIEEANNLEREGFVEWFGSVFEHSPWVAEGAWHDRPFDSLDELHAAMAGAVDAAPEERKMDLIRAHPDLAGKAATEGTLTLESTREHASAGLDRLSPEEYETLNRLNNAYRERFDFPLIFATRENTKETIFSKAEVRLNNSRSEEVETALGEIAKIARFRLYDLVKTDRSGD